MRIPDLHVGKAMTAGPLTVFPVWTATEHVDGLVTGAAANVDVSELAAGAQVARLTVVNRGPGAALLLEGELLEGGWQTRALAADLLLAPGATAAVDVACVEQGRWAGGSAHARRARRVSPSVHRVLRGDAGQRQRDVWATVDRYERAGARTKSKSLADHLDRLGEQDGELGPLAVTLPGQSGVIIGIAGWPAALELFGSRAALAAHLPGILAAARLDAALAGSAEPVPGRRARRFAEVIEAVPVGTGRPAAGDGYAVAGQTPLTEVRGLAVTDGRIAHLSVLNLRHELLRAAA